MLPALLHLHIRFIYMVRHPHRSLTLLETKADMWKYREK